MVYSHSRFVIAYQHIGFHGNKRPHTLKYVCCGLWTRFCDDDETTATLLTTKVCRPKASPYAAKEDEYHMRMWYARLLHMRTLYVNIRYICTWGICAAK